MKKIAVVSLLIPLVVLGACCPFMFKTSGIAAHCRLVPVSRSFDGSRVAVQMLLPEEEALEQTLPIQGRVRLSGFPLGIDTEQPRQHEIAQSPSGQRLRVFIDQLPPIEVDERYLNESHDVEEFFEEWVSFPLEGPLAPGAHLIRVLPVLSYNESVKGSLTCPIALFYYQKHHNPLGLESSMPLLTYNEPYGRFAYEEGKPLLLDFQLSNCQISEDGYKVRIMVDGETLLLLDSWSPYYLYGLKPGRHEVAMELLTPDDEPCFPAINLIQREVLLEVMPQN